jgi:flagellar hook-associated protein 2
LSGGTLQRGTNLQYSINNGGTLTSQSNTIDATTAGIAGLTVTALGMGSTSISVKSDTATISSAISSFVTDYNAVQTYISGQIKPTTDSSGNVTPGTLTGDLDAEGIVDKLRQLVGSAPSGLTGTIKTLNDLGILSNGTDNTLALSDTTTLNSALTNNLDAVKQLFSNSTNGIATTFGSYLTAVNGSNGTLASDESNMTKEVTSINASITSLKARISQDQTRLTNEFVAMETAINTINAQKQYLNAYFNSGTSSSSQSAPVAASSSSSSSSSSAA